MYTFLVTALKLTTMCRFLCTMKLWASVKYDCWSMGDSIQEKVREMRLRWYGHMQRMEENNEVRAVVDMRVPGKRQGGDQ